MPSRLTLGAGIAVLAALFAAPAVLAPFELTVIGTHSLWLAMGAMSIVFLFGYCGVVSLAQSALGGIAGLTMANMTVRHGWGWLPAVLLGLAVVIAVGVFVGAVSRKTNGIYFLMLTLAFAVLVNYQFQQSPALSGHAGISGVVPPSFIGDPSDARTRLYYSTLVAALLIYALLRHVIGSPFGLAMRGVRDQSTRMPALGYKVAVLRTMAFTLAAFVAGVSGLFGTWYNAQIGPDSFNLSQSIDLLIIAVVGGSRRLEGAWIGALVFALLDNYARQVTSRFDTIIGIAFLVVVLASPGGLLGVAESVRTVANRRRWRTGRPAAAGGEVSSDAAGREAPVEVVT